MVMLKIVLHYKILQFCNIITHASLHIHRISIFKPLPSNVLKITAVHLTEHVEFNSFFHHHPLFINCIFSSFPLHLKMYMHHYNEFIS